MSSDKNTTEITLLDRKYLIACTPQEQDGLLQAARHLNKKMLEIRHAGKVLSLERLAIIAALNITNEFLQLDEANLNRDAKIVQLNHKMDSAIAELDTLVESRKVP
ncbi:MAG TPA: cell division protein ZapA [Marinospirillum sp.]|uniref:cell division protein ZapA n=1 Tax=Marinospirillum sp. TaxID=2183934 RepID=UPI002B47EA43|nr:cell division protein ZapA [Marinospirillum sp.]HKM14615.1 cell division protein ZapA [Marinospirillum sp.]